MIKLTANEISSLQGKEIPSITVDSNGNVSSNGTVTLGATNNGSNSGTNQTPYAAENGKKYQTGDRAGRTVEEDVAGMGDALTFATNYLGDAANDVVYETPNAKNSNLLDQYSRAQIMARFIEAGYSIDNAYDMCTKDNDTIGSALDSIDTTSNVDAAVAEAHAKAKQKISGSKALANTVTSQNERAEKDNNKLTAHYSGSNSNTSNSTNPTESADNSDNSGSSNDVPKFNPNNIGFTPQFTPNNESGNQQQADSGNSNVLANNWFARSTGANVENINQENLDKFTQGAKKVGNAVWNGVKWVYNTAREEAKADSYKQPANWISSNSTSSNSKKSNNVTAPAFNPYANNNFGFGTKK